MWSSLQKKHNLSLIMRKTSYKPKIGTFDKNLTSTSQNFQGQQKQVISKKLSKARGT